MHRVELKETVAYKGRPNLILFLMHRVELKGYHVGTLQASVFTVPNAPCGVESPLLLSKVLPCILFLMHRVELKGSKIIKAWVR